MARYSLGDEGSETMARYWTDFESRAKHILNDGLDVAFERNKKNNMTARFRICQI